MSNRLKLFSILFVILITFPFRIRGKILIFNSISIFDIALIAFSIMLLLYVLYNKGRLYVGNKSIFLLLCVPLFIALFSIVWSKDVSKTFYYIIVMTEAVLSYLVIINLLRRFDSQRIMSIMACMVLLIIILSFLSFYRVPGFAPFIGYEYGSLEYNAFLASYYTRLSSPFLGLSNNLASVLAYFFFLSWTWYVISRVRSYLLLTVIIFVSIIMTMSKGTLLAIAITIPFFIYWQKLRIKQLIQVLFLSFTLSAGGFVVAYNLSEQFRKYAPYVFSIERALFVTGLERLHRAEAAVVQITRSPLYGYGARVIPKEYGFLGNVHNTYLEQIMWFGLPLGMINILALIALPLIFMHGLRRRDQISRARLGIAAAIVCQLLIFITESSFEGQFLKILFYVSVGFSVALVNSLARSGRGTAEEKL